MVGRTRRDRVSSALAGVLARRLTVVVAPAGSGKTTALAHYAAAADAQVVWYRVQPIDSDPAIFVAHLAQAVSVVTEPPGDHQVGDVQVGDVQGLADLMAAPRASPLLLILDDAHLLDRSHLDHAYRSASEHLDANDSPAVVRELLDHEIDGVHLVISSRSRISFDTSRLELDGEAEFIDTDLLRFRTWEAERLIGDEYGLFLTPQDVARLTRRVEGWAAGYRLFHLATRDKSQRAQRVSISVAPRQSSLAHRYMAHQVLDALPDELNAFLLNTCVLGTLDGALADRLLGRTDSTRLLGELRDLALFVRPVDDTGTFRYHEVLRAHLEVELRTKIGDGAFAEHFGRAGELLDVAGSKGEALRCFARAGRWSDVKRLAGTVCASPFGSSYRWLDALPSEFLESDPWLLMASARAELGSGRFTSALIEYRRVEQEFGDTDIGSVGRRERMVIDSFLDPIASDPDGWLGELRRGMRDDPLGAAARLDDFASAEASVAAGMLRLLAGHLAPAAASFDATLRHSDTDTGTWAVPAARLARQAVRLLRGLDDFDRAAVHIENLIGATTAAWIERLVRSLLAIAQGPQGASVASVIASHCDDDGDPWGAAFAHVCAGLACADDAQVAVAHFERGSEFAGRCEARLIEAIAAGGLAAADEAIGRPTVNTKRRDRLIRLLGLGSNPYDDLVANTARFAPPTAGLLAAGGTSSANVTASLSSPASDESANSAHFGRLDTEAEVLPCRVRCFGEFELIGSSGPIDLGGLRPRARNVLQRLVVDEGRPVHRDVLVEDLWQGAEPESAQRGLQVAVSAVRKELESAGTGLTIDHIDNAYRLSGLPPGASDLTAFEQLRDIVWSGSAGSDDLIDGATQALALYRGELLTNLGTTEWVVGRRSDMSLAVASVARAAVSHAIDAGDFERGAILAERGIEVDRFDDTLWQQAIVCHESLGNTGLTERLRRSYENVLTELGIVNARTALSS